MLPETASLASYGGPKNDYSAVIDPSTDWSAAGVNPAYGDVAALTHTAFRVWAHPHHLRLGRDPDLGGARRDLE